MIFGDLCYVSYTQETDSGKSPAAAKVSLVVLVRACNAAQH